MTAPKSRPKLSLKPCASRGCYLNARPSACTVCGRPIPAGYPRHSTLDPETRKWRDACCPCAGA